MARVPVFGPLRERFMAAFRVAENGCWEWQRPLLKGGYGKITSEKHRKTLLAHRVSYELYYGQIPNGLVIDHLCRNRKCVNPAHLQLVTLKQNLALGIGTNARAIREDKCTQGHPLSGDNIYKCPSYEKIGYRKCKICHANNVRRYKERKRAGLV